MITAVDNSPAAIAARSQTQSASSTLNANLNTFLTLLTQQLQNQDPLSPMDTAEFTNQLVLYTQAEQQIQTNDSLETLIALNRGTIGTQALGYIGKEVGYIGNDMYVASAGESQSFTYSLAADAASLALVVKDAEGNEVRKFSDPDKTGGTHEVVWDGKNNSGAAVEPGIYTITVAAIDNEGQPIRTQSIVHSMVTGLESDGRGSVNLTIEGNRAVDLSSIYSVWSENLTSAPTTQQGS